jgi:DNA-binding response OmpR family regulator
MFFNMTEKSKPKLLIVEDAPEVVDIIRIAFKRTEIEILHAANGIVGLELFNAHQPTAIILDLGIPGMDGWEFLERVRQDEGHGATVPVIVLTAYGDYNNRKTGKLFNVQVYMQKPIDLGQLRTEVDNAIYLQKRP